MAQSLRSITDQEFDSLTFDSATPAMVMFGAERCTVCKELLPTVQELAADYAEKMNFFWVDVDEYKSLFKRFRLRGIPQLLVFDDGEIKVRIGGLKSKEEIIEKISDII